MKKKEHYRHKLPHFQQPGQAYFVTWSLKDALPKKALKQYSDQLEILKSQMNTEMCRSESSPPGTSGFPASPAGERSADSLNVPIGIVTSPHPGPEDSDALIHECVDQNRHVPELRKQYYALRKKYIKAYNDLLDAEKNPKINLSKPENLDTLFNTLKFWHGKKVINYAFCIMPNHIHWVIEVFKKDVDGVPVYLQDVLYSVKRFSAGLINKQENRNGKLWQKESFDTTIRDEKHLYNAIEYTLNNPVSAGLVKNRNEWPGNWCTNWDQCM